MITHHKVNGVPSLCLYIRGVLMAFASPVGEHYKAYSINPATGGASFVAWLPDFAEAFEALRVTSEAADAALAAVPA